ncbi:hypothetical protein Taro_044330, partial [Colocasia esculenta]|nr:hypothetical protein [Colocasia esculenta]
ARSIDLAESARGRFRASCARRIDAGGHVARRGLGGLGPRAAWESEPAVRASRDPSAKDRRRRYHGLIMKVKRPLYFAEEKIHYKPLTEKLSAKKSSTASSVARARRASKRKREASPSPSISAEGPSIPSFEEFCSQREGAAPSDDIPPTVDTPVAGQGQSTPAVTPSDASSLPPADAAADSAAARAAGKRSATKVIARRVKKPFAPLRMSQRAAGRAALMKIRQGGQTIAVEESQSPVAISSDDSSDAETVYGSPSPSGSLFDDGSLFKERKRERISALDGIEGDSSSSGERSPVVTSRPEATASPELVLDFEEVQEINPPESSPTVGVDLPNIGEPISDPLSISEVPGVVKKPAPEIEVSPSLAPFCDSTSPLQAPTTQLASAISDKEVAISEAATTSATSGGALNVSSTEASLSSAGLASCSTVVDASLWAEVDAQVDFQVPAVGSFGDFCSSGAMVQGQLSSLRMMVRQNPAVPYERVKAVADQMIGVLIIMGCSLDDWANRVTLLLKLLKRRDYLQRELSDQLTALEMQQSECEAVLNPLADDLEHRRSIIKGYNEESAALDSKISLLQAELHAAKSRRDVLADSKAEQELAITVDEDRMALTKQTLLEVQSRKASLKERISSPHVGILSATAFYSTVEVTTFYSTVEVTAFCSTVGVTAFYSTVGMTAFYFTVEMTAFYLTFTVGVTGDGPLFDFYRQGDGLLFNFFTVRVTAFYLTFTARATAFYLTFTVRATAFYLVDAFPLRNPIADAASCRIGATLVGLHGVDLLNLSLSSALEVPAHKRWSTWVARDSTGVQVGNAAAPWGESRLQSEASHNCTSTSSVDVCCSPVIPGGGGGNHSSSGVTSLALLP